MAEENMLQEEGQQEAVKSNKEKWMDGLKGKYPDRDFSNEDDYYAASMEGYDAEHEAGKKSKADNDRLVELLTANPDVAMFIGCCLEGNERKGLSYLSDAIPASESEEGWEEYYSEVNKRKEASAKAKQAEEEYVKNLEESADALKEFASENKMSEEEALDFVKKMQEMISDKLFSGKIDKEFFQQFYNLINYDDDMASAKEAGRIAGRNEKITAKRAKDMNGSELPAIKATSSSVEMNGVDEENPTVKALRGMSDKYNKRNQLFNN